MIAIYLLFIDAGPTCELYTGSVCYGLGAIGNDYVYVDNSDASQEALDTRLMRLKNTLQNRLAAGIPRGCVDMVFTLMCHNSFPLCDHGSTTPVPRQVRFCH